MAAGQVKAQVQLQLPLLCGLRRSVKFIDRGTWNPGLDCFAFDRVQYILLQNRKLAIIEQYGLQRLHAAQGGYIL